MLVSYAVTFIGNRYITHLCDVERALEKALTQLFDTYDFIDFYVGIDGDFDTVAAACVRRAIRRVGADRAALTLVLPYAKANMDLMAQSFTDIIIAEKAARAHPKAAISLRNEQMIDIADLVIACVQTENGGAGRALRYAEKEKKPILRLSLPSI